MLSPQPKPDFNSQITDLGNSMAAIMAEMAAKGNVGGYQITNADGTINVVEWARANNDPVWRKENPTYAGAYKSMVAQDKGEMTQAAIANAAQLGVDIAKLKYAKGQIERGEKIDTNAPAYADAPTKNPLLQRALAQSYAQKQQGFTPAEQAAYNRQADTGYQNTVSNAIQASGGQGGAIMAAGQVADTRRQQNALQMAAQDAQLRRQNQNQYNGLLNQDLAENARINEFGQRKFANYDMPLFQQRLNEKQALINAGETNRWNANDAIARSAGRLGGYFASDPTISGIANDWMSKRDASMRKGRGQELNGDLSVYANQNNHFLNDVIPPKMQGQYDANGNPINSGIYNEADFQMPVGTTIDPYGRYNAPMPPKPQNTVRGFDRYGNYNPNTPYTQYPYLNR